MTWPAVTARGWRGGQYAAGPAAPAETGFSNSYSLSFDGTDENVDCNDMAALNEIETLTISAWIYPAEDANMPISASTLGLAGIFIQTYGGSIYFGAGSGNYMTFANEGLHASGKLAVNTWAHICAVFDRSGAIGAPYGAFYVDGVAATSSGASLNATTNAAAGTDIRIGRYNGGGGTYYWDGNMDEVAIWDVALSAAQAVNIYKGETNGGSGGTNGTPGDLKTFNASTGTGPLGWWRMGDDDTYPTVINHGSTGATNNGTVIDGLEASGFEEEVP